MKEEEEKKTTKVFKFFELLAHSFSCMLVSFCFVPVLQTIDKHDKVLLYLDAYTHSDCQAPENNIAIRMDNETCYLFKFNAISFELELEKHSSKKTDEIFQLKRTKIITTPQAATAKPVVLL